MTNIKIKELRLENFKCHRLLTITPNGANTSIYGDNATGKTSIYDALTWMLFGKDSLGNGEKNIEIKPLDSSGNVADHDAITAVEAVLLVNGEEVCLRRTYQEIWTTRRGSSEPVFDGNTSEYFVDGVPCKKFAFQEKVASIVDADTFLMLTSVSYFANDLAWQKRREILFDISGAMDDKAIMETDERFFPLLEAMGKLNLTDFKAKILAEKRSLVGARNEIPARINECQKTIEDLMALPFTLAKAELIALQQRREQIDGELLSIERNTAAESKRMELREAQLEMDKLEAENKAYRDRQEHTGPDVLSLRNNLRLLESRLHNAKARGESLMSSVKQYDTRITLSRDEWMEVSGETFTGGNCPTCGQPLPADKLKASRDRFEAGKQKRLRSIEGDADYAKKEKASAESALASVNDEITQTEREITELTAKIQEAESVAAVVHDMDGYQEKKDGIQKWIIGLQLELHLLSQDSFSAGAALRKELEDIKDAIAGKNAMIAKESTLEYAKGRIEELRVNAAEGAERLAQVEKHLYLMDEFSRYKTGFVEESVNSLFRIARFRLFREQANGGLEDRCDVVYEGVPYIALNNGMKINVGIDIINALSAAYGVMVPLFVDNAESVTHLEGSETQVIRLVVSENDKELRVNYEN